MSYFISQNVGRRKTADTLIHAAPVAELADAQGLGPCVLLDVWVQVPPGAQKNIILGNAVKIFLCMRLR